jgi:hypothetical protein
MHKIKLFPTTAKEDGFLTYLIWKKVFSNAKMIEILVLMLIIFLWYYIYRITERSVYLRATEYIQG